MINFSELNDKTKRIIAKFVLLNGSSFVGIKRYLNSHNELSNHVVIADFSYGNAVAKDLATLKGATEQDALTIIDQFNKEWKKDSVMFAINKMIESFEKNQNPETQSNQSKGQQDAYTKVTNSIKVHNETGKLYIYALAVSKQVLVEGVYEPKNSKELTLIQNAVKKYFNLSTAKYRSFIVDEEQLEAVNITGDTMTVA